MFVALPTLRVIGHFFLFSVGRYAIASTPADCSRQGVDTELTSLLQDRVHVVKTDIDRHEYTNGPIDFVYCWAGEPKRAPVDEEQLQDEEHTEEHTEGFGFNEMQYSIRSLQL